MYPGSDMLDALAHLGGAFRYGNPERLHATCEAIDRELGRGPYHYRYTGVEAEEGCFLAARLARRGDGVAGSGRCGRPRSLRRSCGRSTATRAPAPRWPIPFTGAILGNLPQGLTHSR